MELYSSIALLSSANELMDSARGFSEETLERLLDLRGKMLNAGFDAPFAGVLAKTASEMEELSPAEIDDLKKQVGSMRYIASLKKFTLNRARVSIAAHRLAKFLGDSGSLPMDGNFVRRLAEAGDFAIVAYREMMDSLEGFGSSNSQAIATVEYSKNGERHTATMRLASGGDAQISARAAFGPDAKIASVRLQRGKSGIIRGKGTRIAILAHFAIQASLEVKGELDGMEGGDRRVALYNSILSKNHLVRDSRLDSAEGFLHVKKELEKAGLMKKGKGGRWELEGKLEKAVSKRRKFAHAQTKGRALERLWRMLFLHYMGTNAAAREAQKSIPGLASRPTAEQLEPFGKVNIGIPDSVSLVQRKIGSEGKSGGMDARLFGIGYAAYAGGATQAAVAKMFGVGEKEALWAKRRVGGLLGGRGAEFLSKLKRGRG